MPAATPPPPTGPGPIIPLKEPGIHKTAARRRQIAITALGRELDGTINSSSAARLRSILEGPPRSMIVSGDIDGLVSAAMLASVASDWRVVAVVCQSQRILLHPELSIHTLPTDLFGVDVFSLRFDNVSNHVVEYGSKKLKILPVREAFERWDRAVEAAARVRLLAVPSIWAGTRACYEDADRPESAKYKYPLGTAQVLLALLEAAGHSPRFYDRHFLPWLIANCDGGVSSFSRYAYNASIWWSTLAGAVGPASLTEQIYQRVAAMRPHDFIDAVNRLDRERQAAGVPSWLNDDWNLVDQSTATLTRTLSWITDLTGWTDCVQDGANSLATWTSVPVPQTATGMVYLTGANNKETRDDPQRAALAVDGAVDAINANFYFGGYSGSRFNWVGGWPQ